MDESSKPDKDKPDVKKVQVKTTYDFQRLKLEKLMKNPEKPVIIPDRQKEKKSSHVPDFVRNVMGSSAGAGSGEFHVYRHLRRKEYARQKNIHEKSEQELLDEEFQRKIQQSKQLIDEKTAKKRAKRLKNKQKLKLKKVKTECNKEETKVEQTSEAKEAEKASSSEESE